MSDQDKTVRLTNREVKGSGRLGEEATVRLPPEDEATVRLDSAGKHAGKAETAKQTLGALPSGKEGEVFAPGQTIDLGGEPYVVRSIVSVSSGEAVIYEVEGRGQSLILKHYRKGYALPRDVVGRIQAKPGERLIKIYTFGRRNEQDYELMEYARGGALDQLLRDSGPIRDLRLLKLLVGQMAEGLQELHERLGIIYQDLKPENVYFRDTTSRAVVLADFGISSTMESGKREALVRANGTKEYAAPELSRFGNQTDALVDPGVDYFALGVTMLHLWLGAKPFQGVPDAVRLQQIRDKTIQFPADMDADYRTLIQGLVNPLPKERWGYAEVKKWLSGEPLRVDYSATLRPYEKRSFSTTETFGTPAELAALLAEHPDRGADYLFFGKIKEWLDKANDMELSVEIEKITTRFADQKRAGVYRAVYTLDPERPFVSRGGRSCSTPEGLGDALLAESACYLEELKDPLSPVYLYLEAVGGPGGKEIADSFRLLWSGSTFRPQRALSSMVLRLQSNGEGRIKLGGRSYRDPESLSAEADIAAQEDVRKAIATTDSLFLSWLAERGVIGSTEAYTALQCTDLFVLLRLLPFCSYRELIPDWEKRCIDDACGLVHGRRFDLLDYYLSQKLPINGNATPEYAGWAPTPLNVAVAGSDPEMVSYLLDHGADPAAWCGDDSWALNNAVRRSNDAIVKILLEHGADPGVRDRDDAGSWPLVLALSPHGVDEDGAQKSCTAADAAVATLLLEHGASPNVADQEGWTPLHLAIRYGEGPVFYALMELLIKKGADTNARRVNGYTPLMNAVLVYRDFGNDEGRKQTVELLLAHGARTQVLSAERLWSPLMTAGAAGLTEMARLLVKKGAKKHFADADGDTAFTLAKAHQHDECAAIVDPGKALALRRVLLSILKVLLKVLTLTGLFFSLDALTRTVASWGLGEAALAVVTFLLSQLLAAYVFLVLCGSFYGYWVKLRGTFGHLGGVLLYLVGLPILFPLAVALIEWGLSFVPAAAMNGLRGVLGYPAGLVEQVPQGMLMALAYLVLLAAPASVVFLVSSASERFQKVYRMYKRIA